jgi:hypothetical protein
MLTAATFRDLYPEFTDPTVYTDAAITQWLYVASIQLNVTRWAELLDVGTGLFVAHQLALSAPNVASGARGSVPGQSSGPIASKSVGPVSVSYDTGAGMIDGAGNWNLTNYGTRFIQYTRMVGAGALVV